MNCSKIVSDNLCRAALALTVVMSGCSDSGPPKDRKKDLSAAASTMLGGELDEATKAARAADEAKRRVAYEGQQKVKNKIQAKFDAAVKEFAVVPDGTPIKVDDACTLMLDGYHNFRLKQHEGDDGALLRWYADKPKALGELRAKCNALGSAEIAACQGNLLAKSPGGLLARELDLMKACVERFGSVKGAAISR
jgi:hypothetical protein